MADTIPIPYDLSESSATGLGGTRDSDTGIAYIAKHTSPDSSPPLEVQYNRIAYLIRQLLDTLGRAVRTTGGERHIGVYPFDVPYADGSTHRFSGATGYELTGGDGTYKVWIDRSTTTPALAHGTSWPSNRDDYLPLAEYTVSGGKIVTSDKAADRRSLAIFAGFVAATAGSGTSSETFTIDSDNAGAGVDTALAFNRGSTAADARLRWDESNDRFVLDEEANGPTAAKLELAEVLVAGATVLDANGAQKVAAGVAGDGLQHAGGVLSVKADGSTLEVDASAGVRIKDGGVTASKLDDALADKLVQVSISDASGASPVDVTIQVLDRQGNGLAESVYLEVGVFDDQHGQAVAANATISVVSGTDLSSDNKAKRIITDASGQAVIRVADGTSETVYLLARATWRSRMLDCADYGTVTIS